MKIRPYPCILLATHLLSLVGLPAYAQQSHSADSPAFTLDLRANLPGAITLRVRNQDGAVPADAASRVVVERHRLHFGLLDYRQPNAAAEVVYTPQELELGWDYQFHIWQQNPQSPFEDALELWATDNVRATSQPQTIAVRRAYPYVESVVLHVGATEVQPGGTVPAGSEVRWSARVVNPSALEQPARVVLWLDRDRAAPIDRVQQSDYYLIPASGNMTISGRFTPPANGTYARVIKTETAIGGRAIMTDSYTWRDVFTVGGTASLRLESVPFEAKGGTEFTLRVRRTNANGSVEDVTSSASFSGTDDRMTHLGGGRMRVGASAAPGPALVVARVGGLEARASVEVRPAANLPQISVSDFQVDGRRISMEQQYGTGHKNGQSLRVSFEARNVGPVDLLPGEARIEFEVDFSDSVGQGETNLSVLRLPSFFPDVVMIGVEWQADGPRRIYRVIGLTNAGVWRAGASAKFEFLIRGATTNPLEIEMRVATEATSGGVSFRNPQGTSGGLIRPFRSVSGWHGYQFLLRFVPGGTTRSASYEATFSDSEVADIHAEVMTVLFIDGSIQLVVAVSDPARTGFLGFGARNRYELIFDVAGNYFTAALENDRTLIVRPSGNAARALGGSMHAPMSLSGATGFLPASSEHWLFDGELELILVEGNQVVSSSTLLERPSEAPQTELLSARLPRDEGSTMDLEFRVRGVGINVGVSGPGYEDGAEGLLDEDGRFSLSMSQGVRLDGTYDGQFIHATLQWTTGEAFDLLASPNLGYGLGSSGFAPAGGEGSLLFPLGIPELEISDVPWILGLSVNPEDGMVAFGVEPNTMPGPRTGSIILDGDFLHHVFQEGVSSGIWRTAERYGEWRFLEWFGWFADPAPGWISHAEHGWWYVVGGNPAGFFAYDFALEAWGWTGGAVYPWIYWFDPLNVWTWYLAGGTPGDRLFTMDDLTEWTHESDLMSGLAVTRVIELAGDLSFGSVTVGQSATRTLTITNTGNSTLTVSGISYPSSRFSGNWSGTIEAGASRNVTLTFAPQASHVGAYNSTLTVNSDATGGTNTRAISGTGVSGDGVTLSGMVLVQGGTLPAASQLAATAVSTFYIGRYEVTWGEWQEVRTWAAANAYDIGSRGAGCAGNHPVQTVSWYDVVKWCNAKSEREGLAPVYSVSGSVYRNGQPEHTTIMQNLSANGYRLPLEAEWEFAARGGTQSQGFTYAGSNDLNAVGWYDGNSSGSACDLQEGRGTWPVGQKAANELGLYDMSGNVWEWCWDVMYGSARRIRGGSCLDNSAHQVWNWGADSPHSESISTGFRLARSAGL